MMPTDPLTGPLFGRTQDGKVFFPFGNRAAAVPVNDTQIERLRQATIVTVVILVMLLIGAAAFIAGVTLMWIFSGQAPVIFGVSLSLAVGHAGRSHYPDRNALRYKCSAHPQKPLNPWPKT